MVENTHTQETETLDSEEAYKSAQKKSLEIYNINVLEMKKVNAAIVGNMNQLLHIFNNIIDAQNKELTLYRQIDFLVMGHALDDSSLQRVLSDLSELRAEMKAVAEKARANVPTNQPT